MSCAALGCRFPSSHLTRAHRCGRCGGFGHGLQECGDPAKRRALRRRPELALDAARQCAVAGCAQPWSHETAAHHCPGCGARGGARGCCAASPLPVDEGPVRCPTCRTLSAVDEREIFAGGGCVVCLDAATPCVVMTACRHANVCKACVAQLRLHP